MRIRYKSSPRGAPMLRCGTPCIPHQGAFSLVEILVAITIFAFLVTLLAGLLSSGLDIWKSSEAKGDASVRAQLVIEQVQKDIGTAFAETEVKIIVKNGLRQADDYPDMVYYPEPNLCARQSAASNHQWLYLACVDKDDPITASTTSLSYPYVRGFKRIGYGIGAGAESNMLIRAVFDRATISAFWQADLAAERDLSEILATAPSRILFDGVAYLGFRFMATPVPGVAVDKKVKWDSREGDYFDRLRIGQPNQTDSQTVITQTLPASIEMEVIVRASGAPKVTLAQDAGANETSIKLSQTRPLVGPPGYIKIDNEWMSFSSKDRYNLNIDMRGAKNTVPAEHSRNAEVIYGELFKVVFQVK